MYGRIFFFCFGNRQFTHDVSLLSYTQTHDVFIVCAWQNAHASRPTSKPKICVQKAALKRSEELFPGALEKLRNLCAFGPADGDDCANKVSVVFVHLVGWVLDRLVISF